MFISNGNIMIIPGNEQPFSFQKCDLEGFRSFINDLRFCIGLSLPASIPSTNEGVSMKRRKRG